VKRKLSFAPSYAIRPDIVPLGKKIRLAIGSQKARDLLR